MNRARKRPVQSTSDPSPAGSSKSRQRSGSGNRRLLVVVIGASLLVVALVASLAAWQTLAARAHLKGGAADLRHARSAFQLYDQNGSFGVDAKSRGALVAATNEFAEARDDLRLWSALLEHLGWVPRVGGQLSAGPGAADAAYHATDSALHLLDGLTAVWAAQQRPAAHTSRLEALATTTERRHADFVAAQSDADAAAAALRSLPAQTGSTSLDSAIAQLRVDLPILRAAGHWMAAAPAILGFDGPSRYLVLLQNPAEGRASGGFLGAVDYVTLDRGAARMLFSSSALPYETSAVPTPLPTALYTPEAYWILRDSNWSPDFPLSARIARWFYGEDTGRWEQGVVGLEDTGINRLLAVTGPVYVPSYARWVNAGNVDALTQHYVNGAYHGPSHRGGEDTVRKQFLGQVIKALVQRLQTLPSNRLPALARTVVAMISTRQLQIYDRRQAIATSIGMSQADGALRPVPGDFLSVVDENLSYNKINPYVHETAHYSVSVNRDLWLDSTLTIRYHVNPSPDTLEGQGPGYGLQGSKHDYEDFLRVYVPAGAHLLRMSGADVWAPAPAYGLTQFAGQIIVREGQTRTVTIHYRVPANALLSAGKSRYSLTVRRQPGTNLANLTVSLNGAPGVTLGASGAAGVARELSLGRDASLDVPLEGRLSPRPVTLPRQNGQIDPYIPFGNLHDPRHSL